MRAYLISGIYGFGIMVGLNLSKLLEINQDFQASWFNVGGGILLAVALAVILEWEKEK